MGNARLLPWILGAGVFAVGCGGSNSEPETADGVQIGVSIRSEEATDDDALPRYFTVEVRADGLWLDGQLTAPGDVDALLAAAAEDPDNRGAALILYAAEPSARDVLSRIARAGFTHVVISGMSAESFLASASDPRPPAESSRVKDVDMATEPVVEEEDLLASKGSTAADVEVKHYGLHIGGGPNTDEERSKYLGPIGKRFTELQECHLLAKKRTVQASFGVDLLISSKGGRAKVQDYRTRLAGKDFQSCVIGVIGDVKFPAPGRPTVVSYSVLFKPL